ncbi:hypothetical protein V496_03186 [Pseudogymnoascus sp. VKM F-4515 (FW-2607)]|nr:hypothetical protein V496_03186 [Pseudogymnoascus sp. VKM F-4515 (FW-2607)]KFY98642.1 hypothetical protein V498_01350 [Pseudogymnoascus sp. VKM F-4517 (FW-2822)]
MSKHLILPLFLLPSLISAAYPTEGIAITDRFWDCCKPSCGWNAKASFDYPVFSCDNNNNHLSNFDAGTGCNGGNAFLCADQSPWAVNDTFSYGFVGVYFPGYVEDAWCGACYQLDFTSEEVKGKRMVVQAHNTGYDVHEANRFALAIPGGNTSYAGACALQYGVSNTVFGEENVGLSTASQCDKLPKALQAPCHWRFDWFKDAQRPTANFTRVVCPVELTNRTGTTRDDDATFAKQSSAQSGAHAPYIIAAIVTLLSAGVAV